MFISGSATGVLLQGCVICPGAWFDSRLHDGFELILYGRYTLKLSCEFNLYSVYRFRPIYYARDFLFCVCVCVCVRVRVLVRVCVRERERVRDSVGCSLHAIFCRRGFWTSK
jgi:hypothetical protein